MITSVKIAILGSATLSFIISLILQKGLSQLLDALKHLQLLLHLVLIESFITQASSADFTKAILEIMSFEVLEINQYLIEKFNIKES